MRQIIAIGGGGFGRTVNKNHILRYMMPVGAHYVNSLSPQCKRTVTITLRYVTQIEEVGVIDQLPVTMKPHECSVDLGNVNTPITTKYVTIALE